MSGIGKEFYQSTKYAPQKELKGLQPPAEPQKVVSLPVPPQGARKDLAEALSSRRSRRKFTGVPLSLAQLSFLLWASDGVSEPDLPPLYRTAPSAGAKHPIDTYVVATRVEGLEPGVYRYMVEGHSLELLRRGDFELEAVEAAAGQEWIKNSAALFVWTAVFERTTSRYKDRGYRYVFLDAGHIAQNLYLSVEALGLGMTAIAALIDDAVNAIVGVDGIDESVVYMAAVGDV